MEIQVIERKLLFFLKSMNELIDLVKQIQSIQLLCAHRKRQKRKKIACEYIERRQKYPSTITLAVRLAAATKLIVFAYNCIVVSFRYCGDYL